MARLTEIVATGGPVAMVLADLAQGVSDGVDVLAGVRNVSRTTRCVLLLEWGLRGDQMPAVSRAVALGVVDTVLTKPTGPRDEEFHGAITEDLGEWSWTTAPVVEAVRIVGADQGAAERSTRCWIGWACPLVFTTLTQGRSGDRAAGRAAGLADPGGGDGNHDSRRSQQPRARRGVRCHR